MQTPLFSFTTTQAARTVGVSVEALRTQYQRTGAFRGVIPTKLPNGRLLWPRADIMALASQRLEGRKTWIDLRATNPWIEERSIPTSDPVAQALAIALCDPRDDTSRDAQSHLDDLYALRHWVEAQCRRLNAARPRLSAEQRTNALRLLALAIAPAVIEIPEAVMAQAVADVVRNLA